MNEFDTYASPTPEGGDSISYTAPTTPVAPEAGRNRSTAVTVLILAAIFAAICVAVGVTVSLVRTWTADPVERTLQAVFPQGKMIETLANVGGDITVEGSLGQSVLPTMPDETPLDFVAQVQYNVYGEFYAYADVWRGEEDIFNGYALLCMDGLEVASDSLLGGTYTFAFDGLAERLENSVYAPDSGTEYAMNEEVFAALMDMVRGYDPQAAAPELDEDAVYVSDIETILLNTLDAILAENADKRTVTEVRREVALLDRTVKAKVVTYTFDETYVDGLIDSFCRRWQEDERLVTVVKAALRSSLRETSGDMTDAELELYVNETYEALTETLLEELAALRSAVRETPFTATVEVAYKSNYLVSLTATVSETGSAVTDGIPADGMTLSLLFTSNPKKDPSFDLCLSTYEAGKETDRFSAVRTTESGFSLETDTLEIRLLTFTGSGTVPAVEEKRFSLDTMMSTGGIFTLYVETTESNSTLESVESARQVTFSLQAEGYCSLSKNSLLLSIDYLKITDGKDAEPTVYGDSWLTLSVTAGEPTLPSLSSNGDDLLGLGADEVRARMEELEARVKQLEEALERVFGSGLAA